MMINTIYLAGPIKRVPDYVARFAAAVVWLREQWPGSRIFNPAELPPGKTNAWYMARCCRMVCMSDMVYLLPGCDESGGAQVEIALARYCKIPVVTLSSEDNAPCLNVGCQYWNAKASQNCAGEVWGEPAASCCRLMHHIGNVNYIGGGYERG